MIPYIEVRDRYTKLKKAMLTPIDCFFELAYFGVGEFTLKCSLDTSIIKGDFLSIPNKKYIWLITSINPQYNVASGFTMLIKGYQAKKILNDRIIPTAQQTGTDLKECVNKLITQNATSGANIPARNMGIMIAPSDVEEIIEDAQVPRGDLLEFTETLLKTKECGAELYIENNKLYYKIFKGIDRSARVRFSQSFDNLLNSDYLEDNTQEKNYILVEGEDITTPYDGANLTGLDRKEIYYESNVSTKYTNLQGNEIELDITLNELGQPNNLADYNKYKAFLAEAGKEALTSYEDQTKFNGEIDTSLKQYIFGIDYYLGDKVSVKDEHLNIEIKPRVLKMTISQSTKGYGEQIEYGEV